MSGIASLEGLGLAPPSKKPPKKPVAQHSTPKLSLKAPSTKKQKESRQLAKRSKKKTGAFPPKPRLTLDIAKKTLDKHEITTKKGFNKVIQSIHPQSDNFLKTINNLPIEEQNKKKEIASRKAQKIIDAWRLVEESQPKPVAQKQPAKKLVDPMDVRPEDKIGLSTQMGKSLVGAKKTRKTEQEKERSLLRAQKVDKVRNNFDRLLTGTQPAPAQPPSASPYPFQLQPATFTLPQQQAPAPAQPPSASPSPQQQLDLKALEMKIFDKMTEIDEESKRIVKQVDKISQKIRETDNPDTQSFLKKFINEDLQEKSDQNLRNLIKLSKLKQELRSKVDEVSPQIKEELESVVNEINSLIDEKNVELKEESEEIKKQSSESGKKEELSSEDIKEEKKPSSLPKLEDLTDEKKHSPSPMKVDVKTGSSSSMKEEKKSSPLPPLPKLEDLTDEKKPSSKMSISSEKKPGPLPPPPKLEDFEREKLKEEIKEELKKDFIVRGEIKQPSPPAPPGPPPPKQSSGSSMSSVVPELPPLEDFYDDDDEQPPFPPAPPGPSPPPPIKQGSSSMSIDDDKDDVALYKESLKEKRLGHLRARPSEEKGGDSCEAMARILEKILLIVLREIIRNTLEEKHLDQLRRIVGRIKKAGYNPYIDFSCEDETLTKQIILELKSFIIRRKNKQRLRKLLVQCPGSNELTVSCSKLSNGLRLF